MIVNIVILDSQLKFEDRRSLIANECIAIIFHLIVGARLSTIITVTVLNFERHSNITHRRNGGIRAAT